MNCFANIIIWFYSISGFSGLTTITMSVKLMLSIFNDTRYICKIAFQNPCTISHWQKTCSGYYLPTWFNGYSGFYRKTSITQYENIIRTKEMSDGTAPGVIQQAIVECKGLNYILLTA